MARHSALGRLEVADVLRTERGKLARVAFASALVLMRLLQRVPRVRPNPARSLRACLLLGICAHPLAL